jgi:DNA-3-methyladenine glycosylase I
MPAQIETQSDTPPTRCVWCIGDALYEQYHDHEWGVPCFDDHKLFEFLILESAQAGLSWITILRKREHYRQAFAHFKPEKIADFDQQKIDTQLLNTGIVRNRMKIESTVSNARCFLELQHQYHSFSNYLWGFVDGIPIQNHWQTQQQIPAFTALSSDISKDMKKRGFRFFGKTICYAYMQAIGMVNDHTTACFRYKACQQSPTTTG